MSQNTENHNNCAGGTFVKGLVVGGLLGAAAALLLAPKSGRELRSELNDKAQIVGGKTKEIACDLGTRTSEVVKTVGAKAEAVVSGVKDASQQLAASVKDSVASTANELKEASADVAEEVAAQLKEE
ncbi:YtxH domain-containing protein [Paenibacillus apiarius]|uniref:YtxH domain-containing protein n=1 Tax=Paenibacillus apiarius TaxID=46240 RepID=UPI00197D7BEB|nr:YtxH domain-containing protein [Paenibacillus apiarius]MBN3525363.1 YtxH domain-containing protein [Paenibacillus apiarius]